VIGHASDEVDRWTQTQTRSQMPSCDLRSIVRSHSPSQCRAGTAQGENAPIRVRLGEQSLLAWHPSFLDGTPIHADHFNAHRHRLIGGTETVIRNALLGEPGSRAAVAHDRYFIEKRTYLTKQYVAAGSKASSLFSAGAKR
jgi:hypothetical protein